MICFSIFYHYSKDDRPLRRKCLPIACFILIVVTGAFLFQTICMMIKYKSLTDKTDKKSTLPSDSYSKSNGKQKTAVDKYAAKANNDVIDDDDLDDSLMMMICYMLVQIFFLTFWVFSYLAFNSYVQKYLPDHLKQKESKWIKNKALPLIGGA